MHSFAFARTADAFRTTAQGTRRLLTSTAPSDRRTRTVFNMMILRSSISIPVLDLLCCAFVILSTQTYIVTAKDQVIDWTFGMRKGGAQVDGEWLSRLCYAFTCNSTSHYWHPFAIPSLILFGLRHLSIAYSLYFHSSISLTSINNHHIINAHSAAMPVSYIRLVNRRWNVARCLGVSEHSTIR